MIWSYNNLQNRGDCQKTQKSDKASQYVGWVVGRKRSTNTAETHTHFRKPRSPVRSIPRGGLANRRRWMVSEECSAMVRVMYSNRLRDVVTRLVSRTFIGFELNSGRCQPLERQGSGERFKQFDATARGDREGERRLRK